jgi:hypothetical protein
MYLDGFQLKTEQIINVIIGTLIVYKNNFFPLKIGWIYEYKKTVENLFKVPTNAANVAVATFIYYTFRGRVSFILQLHLCLWYPYYGYGSMRNTSTAIYFYEGFTQAPNKFF